MNDYAIQDEICQKIDYVIHNFNEKDEIVVNLLGILQEVSKKADLTQVEDYCASAIAGIEA